MASVVGQRGRWPIEKGLIACVTGSWIILKKVLLSGKAGGNASEIFIAVNPLGVAHCSLRLPDAPEFGSH